MRRIVLAVVAVAGALTPWMLPAAGADGCAVVATVICATPPAPVPATTTTSTTAPPAPEPDATQARSRLLTLLNTERDRHGLAPLAPRADVDAIASGWSDVMAGAGSISHDDAYFTPDSHDRLGAAIVAENVAMAPDIDGAHEALLNSEHHRDNMLDARFTTVGIGATYRDGRWWITQDFLAPRPIASPAPATVSRPRLSVASSGEPSPAALTRHDEAVPPAPAFDGSILVRLVLRVAVLVHAALRGIVSV